MKILNFFNFFTCILAQLRNLEDPDATLEMMKQFFPVFKMSFKNLDHEKMHREMEEDVGEIVFLERMFDNCVGEDADFMTKEQDEQCGKDWMKKIGKSFPQYAEMLVEDDPEITKMIYEILDINKDGGFTREELRESVYCSFRVLASMFVQFAPPHLKTELIPIISSFAEIFPTLINSEEMKNYMSDHPRIYGIIHLRFNQERLNRLFKNVDFNGNEILCERELAKFAINILEELFDLAQVIFDQTDY